METIDTACVFNRIHRIGTYSFHHSLYIYIFFGKLFDFHFPLDAILSPLINVHVHVYVFLYMG